MCTYISRYYVGNITRKAINSLLLGRAMSLLLKTFLIYVIYLVLYQLSTPENVWKLVIHFGSMAETKETKLSWQEIQEKKISMVKERGSRVLKINSPLSSTMFNILRQFDMAYINFKARLGELDGISHKEGEQLMEEGREIVMAFSDYTERLSKRIRFRYYTPREISEFMKNDQEMDSK